MSTGLCTRNEYLLSCVFAIDTLSTGRPTPWVAKTSLSTSGSLIYRHLETNGISSHSTQRLGNYMYGRTS